MALHLLRLAVRRVVQRLHLQELRRDPAFFRRFGDDASLREMPSLLAGDRDVLRVVRQSVWKRTIRSESEQALHATDHAERDAVAVRRGLWDARAGRSHGGRSGGVSPFPTR